MLKIIPLGGLGEIGLNMMVFECRDTLFIVDAGLMFPDPDMPGVDFVIPDMQYLKRNHRKVSGIILTHAHEDHIGALPFLLRHINAPVFGTAFTLGLVRHKLESAAIAQPPGLHEVSPQDTIRLGCFEIEFIRVCHSVVDGVGLAIRTPLGLVIHSGDFKIGHTATEGGRTDVGRLAQLGQQGVLALLSDSTNVEKEGYTVSDRTIGKTLAAIAAGSPGRIIVALFASSIVRIQQIVEIAAGENRQIAFTGRSIETSVHIAKELGHLHIPTGVEIAIEEVGRHTDDRVVIVTTGSQGEPMSALARMAAGRHRQIHIKPEDTVILSSKFIPGNERAIAKIINDLYRRGAEVVYEKISDIHVSGHAFREELKLMINLTRPRYFIPIHGEYRHLVLHGRLACEVGIPIENTLLAENGQVITFDSESAGVRDRVPTGRVLVDGKGIGDVGRSVLRERRLLSEDGLVAVTLAFDEETGIIVYGPEIVSRGFVFETQKGHLLEDAICVVLETVEELDPALPDRMAALKARLQMVLRQYFFFTIGRRPVILPFILEI